MSNNQVGFTKPVPNAGGGAGCPECFTTPEINTLINTLVTGDAPTIQGINDALVASGILIDVQDAFGVSQYQAFAAV